MSAIREIRRNYSRQALDRNHLHSDPIVQFQTWFQQALDAEVQEPNAMTLATADSHGQPSARIVLLKGVDQRGFQFFTNYRSMKAREADENPKGALVFYWPELERQVCVAGTLGRLSAEESDTYFQSRPRGSRLGAWASPQSDIVPNREVLEERFRELERQYPDETVPRPPHWGGYLLEPNRIEFWQGRPNRLHDRFRYLRGEDGGWRIDRLAP